jgi:hypothetical protein
VHPHTAFPKNLRCGQHFTLYWIEGPEERATCTGDIAPQTLQAPISTPSHEKSPFTRHTLTFILSFKLVAQRTRYPHEVEGLSIRHTSPTELPFKLSQRKHLYPVSVEGQSEGHQYQRYRPSNSRCFENFTHNDLKGNAKAHLTPQHKPSNSLWNDNFTPFRS